MSLEGWYRVDYGQWDDSTLPECWPKRFLRVCEVGCNIFIGVDCSTPDGRVIMYDPNLGKDDRDCFVTVADSVAAWLSNWLDERPWPNSTDS